MHKEAINEFWKNYFEEQNEIPAEMNNMTVKEYFETYGAPNEAEVFAAVFRAGKHTERLSEIKAQILQINRKALGRYLGSNKGFMFRQTVAEFMEAQKAGYQHKSLLEEADRINRKLMENNVKKEEKL